MFNIVHNVIIKFVTVKVFHEHKVMLENTEVCSSLSYFYNYACVCAEVLGYIYLDEVIDCVCVWIKKVTTTV